jgi:hypothetical protein
MAQELPINHPFTEELKSLLAKYPGLPQDVKKVSTSMIKQHGNTGCVYYIICTANSRGYVGQTTNFSQRIKNHIYEIGGTGNPRTVLWNLNFARYGISHYKVEILEPEVPAILLPDREKYWQSVKKAVLSCEEICRAVNAALKDKNPSWKVPRKGEISGWDNESIDRMLTTEQKDIILEIVRRYGHTDQPCESSGIPLENFIRRAALQGL